jgi:hypothetical protein
VARFGYLSKLRQIGTWHDAKREGLTLYRLKHQLAASVYLASVNQIGPPPPGMFVLEMNYAANYLRTLCVAFSKRRRSQGFGY